MVKANLIQNESGNFIMEFIVKSGEEKRNIFFPCNEHLNETVNNFINGSRERAQLVEKYFHSSVEFDSRTQVLHIVKNAGNTDEKKEKLKARRMVSILARHAQRAMLYGVYTELSKKEKHPRTIDRLLQKTQRFCYMLSFCVL